MSASILHVANIPYPLARICVNERDVSETEDTVSCEVWSASSPWHCQSTEECREEGISSTSFATCTTTFCAIPSPWLLRQPQGSVARLLILCELMLQTASLVYSDDETPILCVYVSTYTAIGQ